MSTETEAPAGLGRPGFDPSRVPALHRKRDGWLMIRSDGSCYFLDPVWHQGARVAFAAATVAAWFSYYVIMIFGLGRINGLRWRFLPRCGDWAYRDDGGRLTDLAHFIDADLAMRKRRRAQGMETASAGETEGLDPKGDSPVGNADAPTPSAVREGNSA